MEILNHENVLEVIEGQEYLVRDPVTGLNVPMMVEEMYDNRVYFTRTVDMPNKKIDHNEYIPYAEKFKHIRPAVKEDGWAPAVMTRIRIAELLNAGTYVIA